MNTDVYVYIYRVMNRFETYLVYVYLCLSVAKKTPVQRTRVSKRERIVILFSGNWLPRVSGHEQVLLHIHAVDYRVRIKRNSFYIG